MGLGGTLNWSHIPHTVREIKIDGNKLEGRLDLTCLPSCLQRLDVDGNPFLGPADFSMLPESLMFLHIDAELSSLDGSVPHCVTYCFGN